MLRLLKRVLASETAINARLPNKANVRRYTYGRRSNRQPLHDPGLRYLAALMKQIFFAEALILRHSLSTAIDNRRARS